MSKEKSIKNVEMMLISELLKDSHRSDRELAKVIGVSQPTVSRLTNKLKNEGVIREYTIIPNFNALGYHLCAFTFADFQTLQDSPSMKKLFEVNGKRLSEIPEAVLIERGLGEKSSGVIVSFHESYSDYMKFQRWLMQFDSTGTNEFRHFIINLDDRTHYRYLTFSTFANHFQETHYKHRRNKP